MAMTDEQKKAAVERLAKGREAKKRAAELEAGAAKTAGETAYVAVASTEGMEGARERELLAEIGLLKGKLELSERGRSDAEQQALASAQAQGSLLMQRQIDEVATGKTVTVKRCKGYKVVGHHDDGRDILRPVFTDVPRATYFYKVDLPPCGGSDLKINGVPFYHGAVYELDEDTLRSVKEIVYRCWKHDSEIHGNDENFYRKKGAYESTGTLAVPQLRAR